MTIDEEAFNEVWESEKSNMRAGDPPSYYEFVEAYESAKQSNLLALLESPKVVELVANAIDYWLDSDNETEIESASKAALAAITSFIKGDGSATVAPVAGETDYSTSLTPTSYAGGQSERLEPSPSGAVVSSPDRQGEALIAEPPAPDSTDIVRGDEYIPAEESLQNFRARILSRCSPDVTPQEYMKALDDRSYVHPESDAAKPKRESGALAMLKRIVSHWQENNDLPTWLAEEAVATLSDAEGGAA